VQRGAAVKIADAELSGKLLSTIQALLDDRERLAEMGARARALAQPEAARRIVEEMLQLAKATRGDSFHAIE